MNDDTWLERERRAARPRRPLDYRSALVGCVLGAIGAVLADLVIGWSGGLLRAVCRAVL